VRTEFAWLIKSPRVLGLPTHLQIEPSSTCNLKCPMCYITTRQVEPGLMKLVDFRRVIDEVGDYALMLHFWGWGEPFVNPDIFSMIRIATERGLKVITSTNGHFFETDDNIDRLIDSGLDVLIFALDGPDQETYETYRKNGDFEKALAGLNRLARRRRERGAALPRINLRIVVTRQNEHLIGRMKELAEETGVDCLTLKTLGSHHNDELWRDCIPQDPQFRRYRHDENGVPIRQDNSCKKMWNHPRVCSDGTIVPCDYLLPQDISFGNVLAGDQRQFRRIWFGKAFRRARRSFLRRTGPAPECLEYCSLNFCTSDDYVSHAFPIAARSG